MNELIEIFSAKERFRWRLLATVSALALGSVTQGTMPSHAANRDADRPTVWIELGGQLERADAAEQQFAPAFLFATPRPEPETVSPLSVGHAPRYSFGGEGKVVVKPEGSTWIFSASARFGRSDADKSFHQQSYPTQPAAPLIVPSQFVPFRRALQFIDVAKRVEESHAVLDFAVGKEVGLGMLGAGSMSNFNLGLRFAQFGSKGNVAFKSDPDAHPTFIYLGGYKFIYGAIYHSNAAAASDIRSFHGVGPILSWNASTPIMGHSDDGQVVLDWGVNAGVMFGRQKALLHHQTTALYHHGKYDIHYPRTTLYRHAPPDQLRSRSAIVPNLGGFAGLSFRYADAKLNFGYRADFFFGAMDGGLDVARRENISFYGPFATISIGLGGQ